MGRFLRTAHSRYYTCELWRNLGILNQSVPGVDSGCVPATDSSDATDGTDGEGEYGWRWIKCSESFSCHLTGIKNEIKIKTPTTPLERASRSMDAISKAIVLAMRGHLAHVSGNHISVRSDAKQFKKESRTIPDRPLDRPL